MKKFLRLLFVSYLLVTVLLSCNGKNSNGAEAYDAADQMSDPFVARVDELLDQISPAMDEGQSILEYGHYVIELQKELKSFMDTCSDLNYRFAVRRLATDLSHDLLFRTIEDSVQMMYYADSIAVQYSEISYHWYKELFKGDLMFFSEAYKKQDSVAWMFPMNIVIPKDRNKDRLMIIEFPEDAVGETVLYVMGNDMLTPVWSLGPDDAFVQVMERGNEYFGNMAMLFPLDSILPHIRAHEAIVLRYLSDEAPGDKHRFVLFHMREFLKEYDALEIK